MFLTRQLRDVHIYRSICVNRGCIYPILVHSGDTCMKQTYIYIEVFVLTEIVFIVYSGDTCMKQKLLTWFVWCLNVTKI